MGKLTKAETTKHAEAMELIDSDRVLSREDKRFILENYNPRANHNVTKDAVYFTPWSYANDMMVETTGVKVRRLLDLGAGIGMLSFHFFDRVAFDGLPDLEIVCVEKNPEFCRIGKRILPDARWVCGDMFDQSLIKSLGTFDEALSNPPYGLFPKSNWLTSRVSQYAAAEVAMSVSPLAVFLLAQGDCPFKYTGQRGFQRVDLPKYDAFSKATGVLIENNCGIDLAAHEVYKDWPKMPFEIVNIARADDFVVPAAQQKDEGPTQLDLWAA